MTITIPQEIERAAEEMSVASGVTVDTLLLQVLQTYFSPIPQELKVEMDAWNLASDQDLDAFDRHLEALSIESR